MSESEAHAGQKALREFRRWRRGALLADAKPSQVRFVTDPRSGAVVAPVERAVIEAEELVLFVPEETDEALQLLLEPMREPPTEELVDRWRIHHGEAPMQVASLDGSDDGARPMVWAMFDIEGGRLGGAMVDGEALMIPNPAREIEPKLCKRINADRRLLWRVCRLKTGVDVPADVSGGPVCVGVDPEGLHVRGKMGVLRVEFDREGGDAVGGATAHEAPTQDAARVAERRVDDLLRRGDAV